MHHPPNTDNTIAIDASEDDDFFTHPTRRDEEQIEINA
jgi:hypothetical protein